MNPRIQLLAEQAGFRSNPDIYDRNQSFDMEKFARLIVQECAAICQDIDGEDSPDGRCARQDCAVEIKEHFGVEP